MWYLYYSMPNRRLCKVNNKQGVHQCAPTFEEALEVAKPFSFEYPVTPDQRADLHNTRDGKPCDTPFESNNPRLYLDDTVLLNNQAAASVALPIEVGELTPEEQEAYKLEAEEDKLTPEEQEAYKLEVEKDKILSCEDTLRLWTAKH